MSSAGSLFINMHNQNARTVALIVFGLTYLFFGAAVFHVIEKDREVADGKRLRAEREDLQTKYNITKKDMQKLADTLIMLEPYDAATQWDYAGSLYFAIIVLTTIGYGHSVPHTVSGKIFCMIYSLIGVPLYLVMFQAMGERINNAAKYSIKKVGNKLGMSCSEVSLSTLVPFGLFSCILTVTFGTLMFAYFEGWTLLDSGYYCVITLTTIGFGDYVPLQAERALQNRPSYVAFSLIYIVLGLTIIGAFVNLVVLRLMVTTATGEPPKEEEIQVDPSGFPVPSRTDAYQSTSGCNPYDHGEGSSSHDAFDKDHVGTAGVNGDIKRRYTLPRSRIGTSWYDEGKFTRRKHQSLKTLREERNRWRSSSFSKSRHSGGDFYSLPSDIRIQETRGFQSTRSFNGNKTTSSINFYEIEPRKNAGIKQEDKKSLPVITNSFRTYNNFEGDYSKNSCVVCQRSCSICRSLFSPLSIKSLEDGVELSGVNLVENQNKNNNSQIITTDDTDDDFSNLKQSIIRSNSRNDNSLTFSRNGVNNFRHSLPVTNQSSFKTLLEPEAAKRRRNLSMDSGYEGMFSLVGDDKTAEHRGIYKELAVYNLNQTKWHPDSKDTNGRPYRLSLPRVDSSSQKTHLTTPSVKSVISSLGDQDIESGRAGSSCSFATLEDLDFSAFDNSKYTGVVSPASVDFSMKSEAEKWSVSKVEFENDDKSMVKSEKDTDEDDSPSSRAPTIIITMCNDSSENDVTDTKSETPCGMKSDSQTIPETDNSLANSFKSPEVEITSDSNVITSITVDHNILNKLCHEHIDQYNLLRHLLHVNSKNACVKSHSKDSSHEQVASNRDKRLKRQTKNSLPTTKLCSNGSVVTEYEDVVKEAHDRAKSQKSLKVQSENRKGGGASKNSRKKLTRKPSDGVLSKRKDGGSPTGENANSQTRSVPGEDGKRNTSSKSSLKLKNAKLDMVRFFLSKGKQNGLSSAVHDENDKSNLRAKTDDSKETDSGRHAETVASSSILTPSANSADPKPNGDCINGGSRGENFSGQFLSPDSLLRTDGNNISHLSVNPTLLHRDIKFSNLDDKCQVVTTNQVPNSSGLISSSV